MTFNDIPIGYYAIIYAVIAMSLTPVSKRLVKWALIAEISISVFYFNLLLYMGVRDSEWVWVDNVGDYVLAPGYVLCASMIAISMGFAYLFKLLGDCDLAKISSGIVIYHGLIVTGLALEWQVIFTYPYEVVMTTFLMAQLMVATKGISGALSKFVRLVLRFRFDRPHHP